VARLKHPQLAYEVVAERLRKIILDGRRSSDRLPTEGELCARFGVSRSTIREALRTLASQGLITTHRGVTGGSRIVQLRHQDVGDMLTQSLTVLTHTDGCSVAELLEARELLEIPAARAAAARRRDAHLDALRRSVRPTGGDAARTFETHRAFHTTILDATGNRLLQLMTEPLFRILQTRFLRDRATATFWKTVTADHRAIVRAIAAQDGDAAAAAMAAHLKHLRSTYERIDALAVRRERAKVS
jgi:DNA-binding FadR family transcriptional regulator